MLPLSVFFYVFLFVLPAHVHAYLDPGSGSYIIQLIFGGFLGVAISIKVFWKQIRAFFSHLFHHGKSQEKESAH